jgi:hypothetical protein
MGSDPLGPVLGGAHQRAPQRPCIQLPLGIHAQVPALMLDRPHPNRGAPGAPTSSRRGQLEHHRPHRD